jgi:hypothetical protein
VKQQNKTEGKETGNRKNENILLMQNEKILLMQGKTNPHIFFTGSVSELYGQRLYFGTS